MPRMAEDEARRRFAGSPVARLATVDPQGHPHLVPVVFAVHGDAVVTAVDRKPKSSPRLQRLHNIAARPAVCLLVDVYDEDWGRLWWYGPTATPTPCCPTPPGAGPRRAPQCPRAVDAQVPPVPDWPPDGPVIVVAVHRWSGWEAASGPRAQG